MTLSSAIETVWTNAVWVHSDITSITTNIHQFPVTSVSEFETSRVMLAGIINFIDVNTTRSVKYKESASVLGRTTEYQFTVSVNYTKEVNPDGTTYQAVRTFFETLFTRVAAGLGDRWTDTVDLWMPQTQPPSIQELTLDNRKCWRGSFSYFGKVLASTS